MTGQMLWLALTAQGHEVELHECEQLMTWLRITSGAGPVGTAWVTDQGVFVHPRGGDVDGFWLIREWKLQEVDHEQFARGWKAMRRIDFGVGR